MSQKILNKRSSVFGKAPLPSQIEVGEIAINFNHENPFLSILDSNGQIQKFLSETKTRGLIQDAKEDIDNSFYTKEEINQMFEAFDPSGEIDLDLYYTKVESDSKYQPISGMSSYLTVASAENLYQPKGNYLTEHQSLENYYTKSEADGKFLTSHQDLSDYAQKSDLDDYLTIASASTIYATKEELEEHIPTVDAYTKAETDTLLQGKSDTGHTHDYETLVNKPDLSNFATKGEIPDTSGFATKQELENYQMKSGMTSYLTIAQAEQDLQPKGDYVAPSDLNGYALKSEIPSIEGLATEAELANYQPQSAMTGYSTTAHTHDYSEIENTPDLSGFASLSDIPDTSNFITSAFTEDRYQPKGNYLTEHQSLENYYTKSEADNKFLTSHQDLSDYALKSELPDVSNFVTSAFTDATYAKKGEVPSDAYTKAETDTLLAGKANSAHTHTMSEITDLDIPKTWRGTLAQYNNLTEIDNDTLYIITDSSEQLVTSGQVESMTSGYTNLTEVQTLLEGYSQTGHTHSYNDLTDKPTIPSVEGFATKAELENYQPVSGMSAYSQTGHTHDYSEIQNTPDLSGFASLSDIPDTSNFITSAFTEEHYMKIGSTPTDVYTKAESDSKFQPQSGMTDYALKSELPSTTGLASETWVSQNYQPQSGMSAYSTTAHTHSDLATKAELDDYLTIASASTIYATKEELAEFTPTGSTPSAGYVQNIWVGSLSDYENLTIVDSNTLYCITDEQEQLVTRSYAMNTFATKAMMSDYLTVSAATEMFVEKEAEPLPAYQFVDYIDVSGNTPGIITDYYLTANSVIEFDSEPASANYDMTLYGVTDADWGGMTEGVYAKYGSNQYTYHGYMAESAVQDVPSGRHTFKAGYNYGGEAMAGCQVDDGEIQTCSENNQSWGGQNNLPLGLFGVWSIDYDWNTYQVTGSTWNNNLGMKFNGKFYGCKVYEGNTLMRDYVPCVETSTGKVGIFDTLSDSFYETTASASTTVTGSSSAVTATTEETTSGETSGSTSGETSGETTGQTAYTIDTSVYEVGDYIDLNRDTYDLNYLINGDSKFVLDIYLQAGQNYEEMFGIENGDCFKIGTGESEGSVGLNFGNSRNTQYYIENDGRYVFEMSSGGSVVNGSMVADWSQAGTVYGMTNSHCHLGGLWQVMVEDWGDGPIDMSSLRGEPYYRMYNFKIYEGNTLLRDYRPVKRLSDDAIGWFDVVNQTFMGKDENNSFGEGASLGYNE